MLTLSTVRLLSSLMLVRGEAMICTRQSATGDSRCPNTYMIEAARIADHDGFCSPTCAQAHLQQQARQTQPGPHERIS